MAVLDHGIFQRESWLRPSHLYLQTALQEWEINMVPRFLSTTLQPSQTEQHKLHFLWLLWRSRRKTGEVWHFQMNLINAKQPAYLKWQAGHCEYSLVYLRRSWHDLPSPLTSFMIRESIILYWNREFFMTRHDNVYKTIYSANDNHTKSNCNSNSYVFPWT